MASVKTTVTIASAILSVGLALGGDLSGRILDGSGQELHGATVYIYEAGPRRGTSPYCPSCYADCGKLSATATDGSFTIASLDEKLLFKVLVVAEGHVPRFRERVDPIAGPLEVQLERREHPPADGSVLCGSILDAKGKSVVGAVVTPVGFRSGRHRSGPGES